MVFNRWLSVLVVLEWVWWCARVEWPDAHDKIFWASHTARISRARFWSGLLWRPRNKQPRGISPRPIPLRNRFYQTAPLHVRLAGGNERRSLRRFASLLRPPHHATPHHTTPTPHHTSTNHIYKDVSPTNDILTVYNCHLMFERY